VDLGLKGRRALVCGGSASLGAGIPMLSARASQARASQAHAAGTVRHPGPLPQSTFASAWLSGALDER
jgi:hypothetical protein